MLEPCGDLVDQAFSQFNETLIKNQDPGSQIKNDEIPGAEYPNENDSEDMETNKTSEIPNFMSNVLADNEIAEGINSLNSKQREIFSVVHRWVNDYVKHNGHNFEPIHIFLLGSGGTGTSHLMKIIYHTISKTLRYHCKDPEKPMFLSLRPTGISSLNILETTIHSSLGIKSGSNVLGLNDKSKAALKISHWSSDF